jgi:hypothetical protein
MQVEASFTELGAAPLELRMSRSSPDGIRSTISRKTSTTHAFTGDGRERRPRGPIPTDGM